MAAVYVIAVSVTGRSNTQSAADTVRYSVYISERTKYNPTVRKCGVGIVTAATCFGHVK